MRKEKASHIQTEQMDRIRKKAKRLISPNFDYPIQRAEQNAMT
jgi:hypothetical protein